MVGLCLHVVTLKELSLNNMPLNSIRQRGMGLRYFRGSMTDEMNSKFC